MSDAIIPRPWYVNDRLTEGYLRICEYGGDVELIQTLKAVRMLTVNFIIGLLSVFLVLEGADPTIVGGVAITALALLNGVELSEWLAAKQAMQEHELTNGDE